MRESIGSAGLFQIVMVLLLLFTAYFCLSINYTAAYKVTDSINNQIKKDDGINPKEIANVLKEAHYTSSGLCNKCNAAGECEEGWTPFLLTGDSPMNVNDQANYCIKKIKSTSSSKDLPELYYYKIKVFYNIEVPIINQFNFNIQVNSSNIYTPNETDPDYVKLTAYNE